MSIGGKRINNLVSSLIMAFDNSINELCYKQKAWLKHK